MSIKDINNNPKLQKKWIEDHKALEEKYLDEHPDSLLSGFEKEIRDLGFEFVIWNQILGLPSETAVFSERACLREHRSRFRW